MTIVDERGRLYGRVNLIDAAVAAIVLVLIPFAYGSYLLFRSPPAKVLGINPSRLYQGNDLKVEIQGQDLRPFMRVSFNDVQGRTFLISSPQSAFVDLPALGAGVYDVVLYDYSQEVARLPKALTIMPLAPTPAVEMEVTGAFVGVTPEQLAELKQGLRFPPTGEAQVEVRRRYVCSVTPPRIRTDRWVVRCQEPNNHLLSRPIRC
jgi:hypothetical protein